MPLQKKRISLTIDQNTYLALEVLSDRRQQKISTVSLNLIREALEFQEDIHFSKIADHRLSQKQKRISHKKAWK